MKVFEDFKKNKIVLAIGLFLLLGCGSAFAQDLSYQVTLDENGNGLLSLVGLFGPATLDFGMIPDPGPGGLPSVLYYDMINPPGLVGGDVVILEEDDSVGDVLRFSPTVSLGPNDGIGGVFVYSVPDPIAFLADIGLPGSFNTNMVTLTETNGQITYSPTEGQPGFISGGIPVTYTFVSDPPVPEPGSILMLAGGLVMLGVGIRRKTRRSHAA